jgi:uncharacterized membrane protein YqjE
MILAVSALDPTWRMIFFAAALVLFVLGAVGYSWGKLSLVSAGLAFFTFPFFWDALAAT